MVSPLAGPRCEYNSTGGKATPVFTSPGEGVCLNKMNH